MANFSFQDKTIVILIKDAFLGGAERQALGFAHYIKENFNCKVSIVVIYSNNQSADFKFFLKEIGIEKLYYFGPPSLSVKKEISIQNFMKTVRAFRYLLKITLGIRKLRPDVLVPFMNGPSKVASLIYNFTGAKITFWHQLGLEVYFYDWLEKVAIDKATKLVANAENGLEIFKSIYKIKDEKLFVLPQYVAIQKVELDKKTIKEKLSIPSDVVVIGMIAHYRNEKLQELLIEAFSIINHSNLHLVLLGSKYDNENTRVKYQQLTNIIEKLNIEDKVSLLTGIAVHEVLNILDIGVLVSKIEGTPNVVMEYMLYGLPVIATNHKGCEALLNDSDFLISNDKYILAQKIEKLVFNKDLRMQEGYKNSLIIKNNFPEEYFRKLELILNS